MTTAPAMHDKPQRPPSASHRPWRSALRLLAYVLVGWWGAAALITGYCLGDCTNCSFCAITAVLFIGPGAIASLSSALARLLLPRWSPTAGWGTALVVGHMGAFSLCVVYSIAVNVLVRLK